MKGGCHSLSGSAFYTSQSIHSQHSSLGYWFRTFTGFDVYVIKHGSS